MLSLLLCKHVFVLDSPYPEGKFFLYFLRDLIALLICADELILYVLKGVHQILRNYAHCLRLCWLFVAILALQLLEAYRWFLCGMLCILTWLSKVRAVLLICMGLLLLRVVHMCEHHLLVALNPGRLPLIASLHYSLVLLLINRWGLSATSLGRLVNWPLLTVIGTFGESLFRLLNQPVYTLERLVVFLENFTGGTARMLDVILAMLGTGLLQVVRGCWYPEVCKHASGSNG